MRLLLALTLSFTVFAYSGAGHADSHHIDYYYPAHADPEVFVARADVLQGMDRGVRVGFITGITQNQLEKPVAPLVVMFAKGWEADKLIVGTLMVRRSPMERFWAEEAADHPQFNERFGRYS